MNREKCQEEPTNRAGMCFDPNGSQAHPTDNTRKSMNLAAERIESLKAGSIGAAATSIVFVALLPLQPIALPAIWAQGVTSLATSLAISLAISLITGFLFGVAYRYIVRQDNNSHLREGAVLAFGLVRGLSQVEGTLAQSSCTKAALQPLLAAGVLLLESLAMMAIACAALEGLMQKGWLKPFGTWE